MTFTWLAPWSGTQYQVVSHLIDNAPVLHRWLLFRQLSGGREGVTANALGVHPDGELLYGWAPGSDDMWLDRDVGMEVPAGSLLQLEMQYDNLTGAPSPDASGVEVCVTPKRPAHVAGVALLGTDAIAGTSAGGTCTHTSKAPIRLIAGKPFMNQKGTHMRVDLLRASGAARSCTTTFDSTAAHVPARARRSARDRMTPLHVPRGPRFAPAELRICHFFAVHCPAARSREEA